MLFLHNKRLFKRWDSRRLHKGGSGNRASLIAYPALLITWCHQVVQKVLQLGRYHKSLIPNHGVAESLMPPLSIEQEIREFCEHGGWSFVDQTTSYKKLDFAITFAAQRRFFLEVKEKRQAYNLANWPAFAPEPDLFILDDLTVRKCLGYAPHSGVLVRDNRPNRYHFFSVIDLALMPKVRVNRPIKRNAAQQKGKWLINLQNGQAAATLDEVFGHIQRYLQELPTTLADYLPCYGNYVDETVGSGGIERKPGHWQRDVEATR
jgi:hypothetical protein